MVSIVSRHGYMDDACLNVGIEAGQGLQSAGHGDDRGSEAHDHFMSRMMSEMINDMGITELLRLVINYLKLTWLHSQGHKVARV